MKRQFIVFLFIMQLSILTSIAYLNAFQYCESEKFIDSLIVGAFSPKPFTKHSLCPSNIYNDYNIERNTIKPKKFKASNTYFALFIPQRSVTFESIYQECKERERNANKIYKKTKHYFKNIKYSEKLGYFLELQESFLISLERHSYETLMLRQSYKDLVILNNIKNGKFDSECQEVKKIIKNKKAEFKNFKKHYTNIFGTK